MKAERIARLLPEIYQATVGSRGPLDGFLAAQEALHAPCEAAIAAFPDQLDPRVADDAFLVMLACWMDLDHLLERRSERARFPGGTGRLRELVAAASETLRRRGTAETLIRMVETATGRTGFSLESDAARPFHVRLLCPSLSEAETELVRRIIRREKPAFVTCEFAPAAGENGA